MFQWSISGKRNDENLKKIYIYVKNKKVKKRSLNSQFQTSEKKRWY